jgi:hypothetical protein
MEDVSSETEEHSRKANESLSETKLEHPKFQNIGIQIYFSSVSTFCQFQ